VTFHCRLLRKSHRTVTLSRVRQQPSQSQPESGAHRIRILRISDPIKIDGHLDEPAWSQAKAATDFRQESPTEGAPASERTEVRVLYDNKNLYFGIRAFDSEAAKINARDLVRDSTFDTDDRIEIILDTYHDRRNGFRFAVNPLGTQQDALITDEGKDINRSSSGNMCISRRLSDRSRAAMLHQAILHVGTIVRVLNGKRRFQARTR